SDVKMFLISAKLTVIVGPVGSGKSSLLAAMLGEMVRVSGNIDWARNKPSTNNPNHKTKSEIQNNILAKDCNISYCAQTAWLLHATVRDNITFGQPFIWRRYRKVIQACNLQPDLDSFPAGDLTEVGEKGITLSGGQKQRISLARAVYSETDVVILDSPLSDLDAHVSRHVFEEAILNRLLKRKRTVILVTHHLQYLSYANQVIVMKEGKITLQSKVSEVKKIDPELYESWRKAIKEAKNLLAPTISRQVSQMSVMTEATNEDGEASDEENSEKDKMEEVKGTLVKKEHKETGAVKLSAYIKYMKACTIVLCLIVIVLTVSYHSVLVGSNFWLGIWSSAGEKHQMRVTATAGTNVTIKVCTHFDNSPYVRVYAALSMGALCIALVTTLVLHYAGLFGARVLFNGMLKNVVQAPVRFFDTNPSGRILNRFSGDITNIDQKLAANIEGVLRTLFYTLSAIVVNSITTPYFLLAAIPLIILYYCLQRFFRSTARELQRLDSVTKSPIFAHFSETLTGLQTIRAYKAQSEFRRRAMNIMDRNITPFLFLQTTNRWLGIRLDYMGCLLVFVSAISSLTSGIKGQINPAFIGLSITYSLMMSGLLNWIVRTSAEVEMAMNAVERVLEYTNIPTENTNNEGEEEEIDKKWPEKGCVEFKDISLKYDSTLETVVQNIDLLIQPAEKASNIQFSSTGYMNLIQLTTNFILIGICGRTGSGKSSLTLALFRTLDITAGQLLIDNHDVRNIPLPILRSRISIISQDPVLFNGTVRFNLDPSSTIEEDKLWSALEVVQLKDYISNLPQKLDAEISESGDNLSAGQKKLLCLARAFLRDSRIIILDEATASIDLETEKKLQDIIMDHSFKDKTVITIAHRLSTITKYDRIVVMETGQIIECDTPQNLLDDPDSNFSRLVRETEK
ncbi:hypothetical protein LOTGIDRAFT_138232, partial [Lottia gigantea]